MAAIYHYKFSGFEAWTGLSYAVLSQGLMWLSFDGDWGWRHLASFLIHMFDGWCRLQPGPLLRLSASSLCSLLCPGISHWMEAEFQEQAFWQWARWKLQHLLWHYLRSHMCHIWLVRSESLSLVIIQDYWEISLHLLKQRVSKNRLRFKTTTTAYCPFLHYQIFWQPSPFL